MVVTSQPGNTGQDKLRLVLDYIPCDVCLATPSSEDQDTLCSICARLNRTIVERIVVHGESPAAAVQEPEPAREVEVIVREEAPEPEPAREVIVREEPTEPAWAPAPSAAPAFEMPGDEPPVEEWTEQGVLPPFTVVAPPRGRVGEEWIVPGEEVLAGAGVAALSEDLTEAASETGPGFGTWPAEADELSLEDLEGEPSADAAPEQEGEGWDEPDEQFWEGVLEGREEPATDTAVPTFEPAEDWLEEPAAEPARTTQESSVWEQTIEEEQVSFEVSKPPVGTPEPEPELDFEEVEFTVATPTTPAEADATPQAEWLTEEEQLDAPTEPASTWPEDAPTEVLEEGEAGEELPPWEEPTTEAQPAWEQPPAPEGAPYEHGPYMLYHKVVETGDGETRDLYFFARAPPEDAAPSPLPSGYEVGVNERTGVPYVRRQVG